MKISLYIHIPFCTSKCDYCDFFSVPISQSENYNLQKPVLFAILTELKAKLETIPDAEIETIFIGGGTPSAIETGLFHDFLNELSTITKGRLKTGAEFTTEANLESCSHDFLSAAATGGINRLSLGVQSFNPAILQQIGRACYPEDIIEAAAKIKKLWNGKMSLDIISGITPDYLGDIRQALLLKSDHLSVYQLTIEENTVLYNLVKNGQRQLPDSNLQSESITEINKVLALSGYQRYEISNYAKNNNSCLHNIRYWEMQSYLGVGPSAVSSIYGKTINTRTTNTKDIIKYVNAVNGGSDCYQEIEILSQFDFFLEHYIMGSRLCRGINDSVFYNRFGKHSYEFIPNTFERWKERGMITNSVLNEKGLLFLDAYLSDIYSELSEKFSK